MIGSGLVVNIHVNADKENGVVGCDSLVKNILGLIRVLLYVSMMSAANLAAPG